MGADTPTSLRAKGYFLLPLPARQKEPPPRAWLTRREPYDIPSDGNVAIGVRGDVAILITNDAQSTSWATQQFTEPNVRSARGGHWYFRAREGQANEANRATAVGTMELHVRSKYAVVPPSIHPSGFAYEWVRELPPPAELTEIPDLRELWHPSGEHHSKLLSISAAAAHARKNAEQIFEQLRSWRDGHLSDAQAHPDRELLQMAESAARKYGVPRSEPSGDTGREDGPQLFRDVKERIREHYYFEEEWHYTISALFVMQAWAARAEALPAVFYLYFGGAFSTGKSNVLSLMASLTDGHMLENVSPPALARVMEKGRTVLLDEVDVQRGEELDDVMSALLRSGYRRNGPPYVRWNAKDKKPEILPIFGPKAGTFRSALDPALQSRGFVVPTAKPIGEAHYSLVLANLWPKTGELVPRLRGWSARVGKDWSPDALEALARTPEFQSRVRAVAGELGANRESELLTIALLVAQMVPVDVVNSLSSARELRAVEISEDQAEALSELRDVVLGALSKTVTFASEGREVYRVIQKTVRDTLNLRRRDRQERPVTAGRLALLRRELGVKDAWLISPGHRLAWNLPTTFVEKLRGDATASTAEGPAIAGGPTPSGYSPLPPNAPSYSPRTPRLPDSESMGPNVDRGVPEGGQGVRGEYPGGGVGSPASVELPGSGSRSDVALPEESFNGPGKHDWKIASARRALDPYIFYPDGTVAVRETGHVVWRKGDDPATRPAPPEPETKDQRSRRY